MGERRGRLSASRSKPARCASSTRSTGWGAGPHEAGAAAVPDERRRCELVGDSRSDSRWRSGLERHDPMRWRGPWMLATGDGAAGHTAFVVFRSDGDDEHGRPAGGRHPPDGDGPGRSGAANPQPGPMVAFDGSAAAMVTSCPPCGGDLRRCPSSEPYDGGVTWGHPTVVGSNPPAEPLGVVVHRSRATGGCCSRRRGAGGRPRPSCPRRIPARRGANPSVDDASLLRHLPGPPQVRLRAPRHPGDSLHQDQPKGASLMDRTGLAAPRPAAAPRTRTATTPRRRRRHAAARSRLVSGVLSAVAFLGLGARMAAYGASASDGTTTSVTSTSTSGASDGSTADDASSSSSGTGSSWSANPGSSSSAQPDTTSHGS